MKLRRAYNTDVSTATVIKGAGILSVTVDPRWRVRSEEAMYILLTTSWVDLSLCTARRNRAP